MVQGTSVDIWMATKPGRGIPDFGNKFYVDDTNQNYVDDSNDFYQDGEPE